MIDFVYFSIRMFTQAHYLIITHLFYILHLRYSCGDIHVDIVTILKKLFITELIICDSSNTEASETAEDTEKVTAAAEHQCIFGILMNILSFNNFNQLNSPI